MTESLKIITPTGVEYLISEEDADLIQYRWIVWGNKSIATKIDEKYILLTHMIAERMEGSGKYYCYFINGNHQDCRRHNLVCKKRSTPQYKGVYPKGSGWVAIIRIQRKNVFLGNFQSPELAAQAYNEALDKYGIDRKRNLTPKNTNTKEIYVSQSNTSGYRGVSFHKQSQKWTVTIMINCKPVYIGIFNTKELAAQAYNEAALKYRGPDARINILPRT